MQFFSLFEISPQFAIDERALDLKFRALQAQTHPDKFASASDAERRAAEQRSALVNDAYKTLKDPVLRAAYLIKNRYNVDPFDERDTKMPTDFLMAQLEIREELAEIRAAEISTRDEKLDGLLTRVDDLVAHETRNLFLALEVEANQARAVEGVRKLRFLQKVVGEIEAARE